MCKPCPPEWFEDELKKLDPTGRTRIEWDDSVRRWAVHRDGAESSPPRFLMHICDPIMSVNADPRKARLEESVSEFIQAGVWVECFTCGEIHGTYRDPNWYDLDTLLAISPDLAPCGPREFFKRRRAIVKKLKAKNAKEALERRKEIVDRAVWNLKKAMFYTPHIMTREARIEAAKRREKITMRRLRDKGLAA